MVNYPSLRRFSRVSLFALLLVTFACERELDELEPATFPSNGDVFIDGFPGGLEYNAFGGSDVTAFDTDIDTKYAGTTSMKFSVPDDGSPTGSYAGGAFFYDTGRDLTGYNVLTFWARASQPANLNEIGFGNYFGGNEFVTTARNLPMTTNWQKYYIPIPDAAKLTQERGVLYYSEAPENGRGYTFWLDEVRFENLGTIVPVGAEIFGGENLTVAAETGAIYSAGGTATFNLPVGVDMTVEAAAGYFAYSSSDESVATVQPSGQVVVVSSGEAVITGTLGELEATGSLTISSTGQAVGPTSPAPTPDAAAQEVVSVFSNAYEDIPVDFYNGFWEFSTTQSADFQVAGDDIIRYSQLNFVGIQFTAPTIDVTDQNRFHIDIWTPDETASPASFKVLLVDLGPDNSFGGNDDSSHEVSITAPTLQTGEWVSIDLPLSDFPGLTARANLAQIVLSGDLPNVYADNMYFYTGDPGGGGGGDDEPGMAAPTPIQNSANVISLFSDAYTDVPVDTWRTDWSMADFVDVAVAGNATKKYSALDFVGIETVNNQIDATEMTNFRIDAWSADATSFSVKLVDFGPDGAFDGGDDTEFQIDFAAPASSQWVSYDIPLSDFTGLASTTNIAQLVLVAQPTGAATVWVDNIYFYNDDGGGGGNDTEPTVAAPTPSDAAANVISLFSDAYTDVPVDTWRTEWSMADFMDVAVAGNATKKYSALDFVGIETVNNQIDATGMTHFRVDVWTADATSFSIKLVDFGADGAFDGGDDVEHQVDFAAPAQGQWISYDIPLSDFTGLTTRSNIAQYILVAQPTGGSTVFVDNMYFRN